MVDTLLVQDLLLLVLLGVGGLLYKRWTRNRAALCPLPVRYHDIVDKILVEASITTS